MSEEKVVKIGSYVKVDYEGKLEDGTIFDSSRKHEGHFHFLEFEVGSGEVIEGFDKAVIGMRKGEEKEITLNPDQAYGEVNPKMTQKIPLRALPKDKQPEAGMEIVLSTPDGAQFPAKIIEVDSENITIDLNHPLAGKKLIFNIKIVEIN